MSLPPILDAPVGRGNQEDMLKERRFNGIPPVGNNPVDNKWKLLLFVLIVFMVKIAFWTAYRWACGNVYPLTDYEVRTWVSVFAKPILQLGPVFPLWWFLFKEKGMPFRFTKKNLFTSVVLGCLMALIFYFVSRGVYVVQMMIRGEGSDFAFIAGWDDSALTFSVIMALMFTFMLSTGPAEELFSRGFLQDQLSRSYSVTTAILISSVLFAVGHLPISILVYQLSFETIMWYMVVLVIMGVFFSLMYHWSRNIVFPIIIHGLWDWYLSLMILKGAYPTEFLLHYHENFGMTDLINTVATLMIIGPMIFLLYKVFWQQPVREKACEEAPKNEGPIAGAMRAVRRLDAGRWKEMHFDLSFLPDNLAKNINKNFWPYVTVIAVTGLFCMAMLPLAEVIGTNDPEKMKDRPSDGPWTQIVEEHDNFHDVFQGAVQESDYTEYTLGGVNITATNISISFTWTDEEPTPSHYINDPDTFELVIFGPNGNQVASDTGSGGSIELSWAGMEGFENSGTVIIRIKLTNAGDMHPRINPGGLLTKEDTSNSYEITIIHDTTTYVEEPLPEPHVVW